ncbi:methionine synthase I (cobalamin-dependent), methyltransferase domain [Candidatus Scalindua japonica]|uniref:Methionine synthase I (Cobalamin-dependent), methyltransferase domain n=1 Tax=Candidatus Scalindua japonica TaxID=1284222 RepID=A0A286TW30_9BACT|nr:DUF3365 domain-containing protein [Candidatus Scalindua japonica]GAX60097.1 methionine synthase I (cobalamin-dependent), methyltransferase domain [Candidatus Scalindua japonica]
MFKEFSIWAFILIIIISSSNTAAIGRELTGRSTSDFIKPGDITAETSLALAGDRARHVLYIIDDLYKLYITHTAGKYARDTETFSSIAITQEVFKMMEEKGWHKARFLSISKQPLNPESSIKDDFERDALKAIVSGEALYERFYFDVEGNDYLRAVTSVSMTTKKCAVCHTDKKIGDLIGAISYIFPLEKYLQ